MENELKKITILIIDDSINNIRLLERALEKYAFNIITAMNGKKGIELALSANPEIILLDIMMPEMDGYEVCRELRKNKLTSDIPILMLTAKDDIHDIVEGLNAGANDYITKPFSQEVLRARIRTALRLKSLNDELLEKNKILKELNEIKEQFISMASHDIKNNLTGILGHCYILNMDSANILPDSYKNSIEIIRKRSEKISNLVANLLDLTKIETGKLRLNISKVDVPVFLKKYFEDITLLYRNEKINFHLMVDSDLGFAQFDTEKIDEVLTNLINNAIKFNKENGCVILKCENYDENKLRFSVSDTGIGIDEKDLTTIFDKFTQLKQSRSFKRTFKGSGLGLNIVKSIIEAHSGTTGVISELNKGSEFFFIIPRKPNI